MTRRKSPGDMARLQAEAEALEAAVSAAEALRVEQLPLPHLPPTDAEAAQAARVAGWKRRVRKIAAPRP